MPTKTVDTVVIGAGQAGLSAAHHLVHRGQHPGKDFVVIDSNSGPGGAWRHRWKSLTFGKAHSIHDLPGAPLGTPNPGEPARDVVARYYDQYERDHGLNVLRPIGVDNITSDGEAFLVHTTAGELRARTVINATGTWEAPYVPFYPGAGGFQGPQIHTRNYRSATDFASQRVLVVGGGTSALQFIQELARHEVETVWSTRRAPQWTPQHFDSNWGLEVERSVSERTRAGLRPLSVSAVTGIPLNRAYVRDIRSGVLLSRGPLARLTGRGVVLNGPGPTGAELPSQGAGDQYVSRDTVAPLPGHPIRDDGAAAWHVPIDAILWATGFRANIRHLRGLKVREPGGGIVMANDGVTVEKMPGLFMAGYGASASTLGATRAGRRAAVAVTRFL